MKNKLWLLFLSAMLALSLTACGGDKDKPAESAAESAASGEVVSLEPSGEEAESAGSRSLPIIDEDEEEEPLELDEELPEEFEAAGEGPEDAEWNQ